MNGTENSTENGKQRRLKNLKPWKKGFAPNPRGSSKKAHALKAVREYITESDNADVITIIKDKAKRGIPFFVETFLDRVHGKVPNKQEVTGKDGIPLAVNITFRTKEAADASDLLRKKFESGN